jgi:hypothetical protein
MKIYVTKHCLTKGIQEMDATIFDGYATVRPNGDWYPVDFGKGEWFTAKRDAVTNANERVSTKIKSVERQLAKLRAMKFDK